MLPLLIKTERSGFPAAPVRIFRGALRDGLMHGGEVWHEDILPGHFEPSAVARYNYHRPQRAYMIRKARKLGHQNPMVYTGKMREQLVSRAVIVARGQTVTVQMRGVRALNLSKRKNYPDLRAQVTAADQADVNRLSEAIVQRTETQIKLAPGQSQN